MDPDSVFGQSLTLALTSGVVDARHSVDKQDALVTLMEAVSQELGFRYYALAQHDDLREKRPVRVDLRDYPAITIDHLVGQQRYRRNPVIRGCLLAGGAGSRGVGLWTGTRSTFRSAPTESGT